MTYHVFRDRSLADGDTKFQQFTMNPRGTPKWIILRHLANKLADILVHFRSSHQVWSALPSPVVPESLFMPLDNGLRLDESQRRPPITPDSRKNDPKEPVSILKAWFLRISL